MTRANTLGSLGVLLAGLIFGDAARAGVIYHADNTGHTSSGSGRDFYFDQATWYLDDARTIPAYPDQPGAGDTIRLRSTQNTEGVRRIYFDSDVTLGHIHIDGRASGSSDQDVRGPGTITWDTGDGSRSELLVWRSGSLVIRNASYSADMILNNDLLIEWQRNERGGRLSGQISGTGRLTLKNNRQSNTWDLGGNSPNTHDGGTEFIWTRSSDTVRLRTHNVFGNVDSPENILRIHEDTGSNFRIRLDNTNQTVAGIRSVNNNARIDESGTFTIALHDGASHSFAGRFTGGADLVVTSHATGGAAGTGVQIFTGDDHTYTGTTTITGGTLLVNGTHTGGGLYTVSDGGTLGGDGEIDAAIEIGAGGSLAPGTSVGELNLSGNLTFNAGSFFDVDIEDVDNYDLVSMDGGILALDEDSTIRVSLLDGFSPDLGESFTIFSGEESIAGAFHDGVLVWDGLGYQTTFDGSKSFQVSYGNSVVLTVVPEPGTWLLLLAALACGLLVRRRR